MTGPFHATKALRAGPTQKPEKEEFNLVIGMMSKRNFGDAVLAGRAGQELVPKLPGSHFDGQLGFGGEASHIGLPRKERDFELTTGVPDELRVQSTRAAAKLMIEMSYPQSPF